MAMGAKYSFELKNIGIWVPPFFKHNDSSVALASVATVSRLILIKKYVNVMVKQIGLILTKCECERSKVHLDKRHKKSPSFSPGMKAPPIYTTQCKF